MPTTGTTATDLTTLSPQYEHRSVTDDAWYTIRLLLQSELLIIKYPEFSDGCDDKYWAGHPDLFDSVDKIREFEGRFRVLSDQIQDSECGVLREGDRVCACSVYGDEKRFYDAVVDAVKSEKHSFKNGEEECRCTFILSWLHGPKAGTLEASKVENMCLVRPSDKMDPRLAVFLRICREKLGINSPGSRSGVGRSTPGSYGFSIGGKPQKLGINSPSSRSGVGRSTPGSNGSTTGSRPDCRILEGSRLSSPCSSMQGKATSAAMRDLDLGGADKFNNTAKRSRVPHMVLIDNLDKKIAPSTIVNFIGLCTSIHADAYVFPSLWFDSYTRGALLVDSAEKLQRLQCFLTKPDLIIISSTGRPWILPDITKYDSCSAPYGFLDLNSQSKMPQIKPEPGEEEHALKVVRAGSEEYAKAEQLRTMFLEFSNHQQRLHKRLLFEEDRILQPSMS